MAINLLPNKTEKPNNMMGTFLSGSGDKSYVSGTPAEFKNPLDMAKQGLAKFDKLAGITPAEPYERGRGDYRPSYQSPTLPGAGDPLQLGTKVNAQPEQVLQYNQQQAPATQPDNVMPGGVEVQAPTRPNNIMPGGVEVQAPTRPYDQAPTQVLPSGAGGGSYVSDGQRVHQKRLEDIARLEQANAEKYGTGAKMASMGQTPGSALPDGPTADFGTKEWFKQAHAAKQGTAGRALDIREQEMGQKGELARQKLVQDQAAASTKAKATNEQQQFTNQKAIEKQDLAERKFTQTGDIAGKKQLSEANKYGGDPENTFNKMIMDNKLMTEYDNLLKSGPGGKVDPARIKSFNEASPIPFDTIGRLLQQYGKKDSSLLPNL